MDSSSKYKMTTSPDSLIGPVLGVAEDALVIHWDDLALLVGLGAVLRVDFQECGGEGVWRSPVPRPPRSIAAASRFGVQAQHRRRRRGRGVCAIMKRPSMRPQRPSGRRLGAAEAQCSGLLVSHIRCASSSFVKPGKAQGKAVRSVHSVDSPPSQISHSCPRTSAFNRWVAAQ